MNNMGNEIERWLIEGSLENQQLLDSDTWEVIFDEDRQLVLFHIGPYQKLYLRPDKFVKRFYHKVYDLPVEDWQIAEQIQLYGEFCNLEILLDTRFQATLKYAQRHMEILSEINEYIKTTYYQAIIDLMNKELLNLHNDSWVRDGLGSIEKAIAMAINEMLVLDNIQSQTRCSIQAQFAEFPDVQLGKEGLYLSVLKKSFEVSEEQREESFRQQQQLQEQVLLHKQKQLEQLERDAEIERQKQTLEAEQQKQLLLDREMQQKKQLAIETRLHADKVQHDNYLNEIILDVELQSRQEQEKRSIAAEQKIQVEKLSHQALLKEQALQAEIEAYDHEQLRWMEAKEKANREQLEMERRQQQLKLEMQAEQKKYEEQLQLEIQEQNYKNKLNSDIYLRREIELLELDKKRMELQLALKESRK